MMTGSEIHKKKNKKLQNIKKKRPRKVFYFLSFNALSQILVKCFKRFICHIDIGFAGNLIR